MTKYDAYIKYLCTCKCQELQRTTDYFKRSSEHNNCTSKEQQHKTNEITSSKCCPRVRQAQNISDRSVASIASAVLLNFGFITESSQSKVVDRSKIRRERYRKHLQNELPELVEPKDVTLVQEFVAVKYHRSTATEEKSIMSCYKSQVMYNQGIFLHRRVNLKVFSMVQ